MLSAAKNLVFPHISLAGDYLTVVVAVFGTTISPYLFFLQAAEEVEDEKEDPTAKPLIRETKQAPVQIARMQADTLVGMGYSNIVALPIMLTTAATLNAHGVIDIQTSSQAGEALRPIAGRFAFTIFALGIIGIGLLAVPVLAGSAAYAVGEALTWKVGLAQRPGRARAFYGTIALATLVGAILNFTRLDPISLLCSRSRARARLRARLARPPSARRAIAAQSLGAERETTVDQTLIRGLFTAFRVFVSGLSSV